MNEFRTKLRESCDNGNTGIFMGGGQEKPEENIISSGIFIIKWEKRTQTRGTLVKV